MAESLAREIDSTTESIEVKADKFEDFMSLPPELRDQIYLDVWAPTLINLCQVSSEINQVICGDPRFWRRKILHDKILTPEELDIEVEDYRRRNLESLSPDELERRIYRNLYVKHAIKIGLYMPGAERYYSLKKCTRGAARFGDRVLIDYFLSRGGTPIDVLNGSNGQHRDIFDLTKERGWLTEREKSITWQEITPMIEPPETPIEPTPDEEILFRNNSSMAIFNHYRNIGWSKSLKRAGDLSIFYRRFDLLESLLRNGDFRRRPQLRYKFLEKAIRIIIAEEDLDDSKILIIRRALLDNQYPQWFSKVIEEIGEKFNFEEIDRFIGSDWNHLIETRLSPRYLFISWIKYGKYNAIRSVLSLQGLTHPGLFYKNLAQAIGIFGTIEGFESLLSLIPMERRLLFINNVKNTSYRFQLDLFKYIINNLQPFDLGSSRDRILLRRLVSEGQRSIAEDILKDQNYPVPYQARDFPEYVVAKILGLNPEMNDTLAQSFDQCYQGDTLACFGSYQDPNMSGARPSEPLPTQETEEGLDDIGELDLSDEEND